MDLRRVLHGGQEYMFHGPPPRAGQELTVQTRVAEIYEKEGKRGGTMTFVVTVTEFRDEDGNARGRGALHRDRDRQARDAEGRCVMAPRWDDLDVGAAAEPRTIGPLTRTDFVRYQGASGDFNPIHHDEEFAKSAGLPDGVLGRDAAGRASWRRYATDWLGADNVRNFGVQFREQVWPGDSLVCTGTVVSRIDPSEGANGDERTVNLELVVERVGGGTAIKGWATFAVPA